jgi:hypothetical protein
VAGPPPPPPPGWSPPPPPGTYPQPYPGQYPQQPYPGQYPQPFPGQYPQPFPGQYPAAYAPAPLHRHTAGMTIAQVLVILEAILLLIAAIGSVAGGVLLLHNGGHISQLPGLSVGVPDPNAAVGFLVVVGVILLLIAIFWLWAGIALGRPSNAARWIVLIFAFLGVIGFAINLLSSLTAHTFHRNAGALIVGIIGLAVNAIIISALLIDPNTRRAYAGR